MERSPTRCSCTRSQACSGSAGRARTGTSRTLRPRSGSCLGKESPSCCPCRGRTRYRTWTPGLTRTCPASGYTKSGLSASWRTWWGPRLESPLCGTRGLLRAARQGVPCVTPERSAQTISSASAVSAGVAGTETARTVCLKDRTSGSMEGDGGD